MGKKGGKRLSKREVADALQALFQAHPNETFTLKQIFKSLRLDTHPSKMLAVDILEEMAWDDYVSQPERGSYKLNLKTQVQEGTFIRKANGKNSFLPDDGGKPIFVSERNSMFAMGGDRVRVAMMARRQNHIKEAIVTDILERKHDQAVGTLQVEKDYAFLITEDNIFNHDILIPKKKLKGGKTGQKAVVKITQWPTTDGRSKDEAVFGSKSLVGEVIDVLGDQGDNNVEMHAILAKYGLPYKYPKKVEDAANKLTADITEEEIARREDFRDVTTFTIDPKDAKDFDDALSIRKAQGKGNAQLYEVGVHIADVSHYVTEGSIIDREAEQRATSVYLVDRTIPMLPEHLCNFICSLRPDEEKLCYSVIFVLDENANIKDWHLAHTVIKSNRRFAYEEVQAILEQNGVVDGTGEPAPPATKAKPYTGEYAEELITLDSLAKKLRAARFKNGAVKFDREELHFDIDEKGHPTRCYYKKSKDANKLIEEFMLLANRTVATFIGKAGKNAKTFVYRIHDQPDPQKLESLRAALVPFGYKVKTGGTRSAISKNLNKLMDDVQGQREQKLVETLALRAMMKAKYSTHNIGHYGLAFDFYTHFTSPIRRYPDTMVHRLLTRYQEGGRSVNQNHYEELCEHSSEMEQTAQNAERDSIKYKMVEFMADKIGLEFDAHISGIQSYGIYCEIDENHCEGLVGMHDLDGDYYEFDERNYQLVGRRHHKKYQLGDAIRIKVARADIEKRQLDFVLAE
ncbi:ribonuclease R [Prevotella sp. E13-27]|uniref:ribonuclease R n=1 Tax=Prevotella sp. E13-27 TaxID=2938122 RepID=UPI00200B4218|nr:ribonuclease R [Prevotella sp. E13-27]MCK8621278.1 ribonuclease R [Prevotella sp. E13-27]